MPAPQAPPPVVKEGEVTCKMHGVILNTWHDKYVVLKEDRLCIYKSETSYKAKEKAQKEIYPLAHCQVFTHNVGLKHRPWAWGKDMAKYVFAVAELDEPPEDPDGDKFLKENPSLLKKMPKANVHYFFSFDRGTWVSYVKHNIKVANGWFCYSRAAQNNNNSDSNANGNSESDSSSATNAESTPTHRQIRRNKQEIPSEPRDSFDLVSILGLDKNQHKERTIVQIGAGAISLLAEHCAIAGGENSKVFIIDSKESILDQCLEDNRALCDANRVQLSLWPQEKPKFCSRHEGRVSHIISVNELYLQMLGTTVQSSVEDVALTCFRLLCPGGTIAICVPYLSYEGIDNGESYHTKRVEMVKTYLTAAGFGEMTVEEMFLVDHDGMKGNKGKKKKKQAPKYSKQLEASCVLAVKV
eukprot:g954.t1